MTLRIAGFSPDGQKGECHTNGNRVYGVTGVRRRLTI